MWALFGALLIGLSLGLMGSGGSVLTVPVLKYILNHDDKVAVAESLAIVGAIALVTAIPFMWRREVSWRNVLFFGIPGMVGTYLGAFIAKFVSGEFQLALFAIVILASAGLMIRSPRKSGENSKSEKLGAEKGTAKNDALDSTKTHAIHWVILEGLSVGVLTGLIGVGGGFMIVPALVLLGGLPMRMAIGTSLVIIALKSTTGLYKYLDILSESEAKFDWSVVGLFVLVGVIGSVIGQFAGKFVNQKWLKRIFAVFLIAIAVFVLIRELPSLFSATEAKASAAETFHSQEDEPRVERAKLLLYQDKEDQWQEIENEEQWLSRRDSITDAMQQIMGSVPSDERRCALDVQVVEEVDCDTYVRRLITYQSEPGSRVPAYLLIPKEAATAPAPAALCLHPTDNQVGHKVVVGLGGRPNRQYAQELAERGYVTIAPAYPLLANYQPDLKELGYSSGTMKAIWDNARAIDLLQAMDEVDGDRIAAIGHSLGGHNSVYTAVIDPRIKVVVSSCGLDSYVDYKDGDIRGWTSERYMPKLLEYREKLTSVPFDFPELIGALAPRPVFIIAPYGDSNFKWQSVDRIAESASEVYRLYGVEDSLRVAHPDCDHDFPTEWREAAYKFIENALTKEE